MGLITQGDYAIIWGKATNIKNDKTKNKGVPFTSFSIAYDKVKGEEGEEDKYLYFNALAWTDISKKYLNRLERGDIVFVTGKLEKDTYWSEKHGQDEFKLIVDFAATQSYFEDDDSFDDFDLSSV